VRTLAFIEKDVAGNKLELFEYLWWEVHLHNVVQVKPVLEHVGDP